MFVRPAAADRPAPARRAAPSAAGGPAMMVVWIVAGGVVLAVTGGAVHRWHKGRRPTAPVVTAEDGSRVERAAPRPPPPRARPASRVDRPQPASVRREQPPAAAPALVEEAPSLPAASLPVSSQWYEGADGFRRALEEQRRARAPLLLYFKVDWCPYCQRMDREVLPAPAVSRFLTDVVKVRVNPERSAEDKALAKSHGVDGFPSVFVIPRADARPERVPAFTRSGNSAPGIDATADKFVKACTEVGLGQSRDLVRQGVEKARAGNLDGARAALDRAIELDPQNAGAFAWRGHIEAQAGENGKAIGYLKRAIELNPKDPYAYGRLVSVYGRAGQMDEVIEYTSRMIQVLPEAEQATALAMRGRAHLQKGDKERAAFDFAEACRRGHQAACTR
jgi:tetratricopeptide (TPR) repeat protein